MISIVTPCCNSEKYIADTIQSVFAQTCGDWEMILVNDGSTDGTRTILSEYERMDPRIRVIDQENAGVAEARNRGVREAKGEWIAFLDSDDLWRPEKLEKQLSFAKAKHSSFTFTGSSFIDDEGNILSGSLAVPSTVRYEALLRQNVISCSSVLIRRELLFSHPMKKGFWHEDFLCWAEILREGNVAAGLDEALLVYRMRSDSISGNKKKAAEMNWNMYRELGLPLIKRTACWVSYLYRSIRKYCSIRKTKT